MKTKKINLFSILIFSLLFAISLNAQQNNFIFDFDYAQFGYDSTSNYLEFFYSFDQDILTLTKKENGDFVEGVLHITLEDTSQHNTIVNNDWKISYQVFEDSSSQSKSLIGAIGFIVPKGNYSCHIGGRDAADPNNKKFFDEKIIVKPFMDDNFSISDVELSSKILQDSQNENSIFYKNTYEVIPIPTSVFGENQPVVFYYCEFYQLRNGDLESPLKLNTLVYNSKGQIVYNKNKDIKKNINSRVEVGTVLVNKFPTDFYTLIMSLLDSTSNVGVTSSKKFYVYNPSIVASDTFSGAHIGVLSSEFGIMSEEELDLLFDQSKYIAAPIEIDQYEKVAGIEGKRQFMYDFWKNRDTDPSTPKNEYYLKYFNRVKESDRRFSSLSRVGWKSDRGRVYIMYGEPSEIERFPNQIDSKPYEIWHYNEIEGGVYFVFADLTGFSDYILLHSTMRGELRDDNWARRITSF
ncbi:MAG: GWxTD domain-containing protein [Ignavibacteriaceae bacterium]